MNQVQVTRKISLNIRPSVIDVKSYYWGMNSWKRWFYCALLCWPAAALLAVVIVPAIKQRVPAGLVLVKWSSTTRKTAVKSSPVVLAVWQVSRLLASPLLSKPHQHQVMDSCRRLLTYTILLIVMVNHQPLTYQTIMECHRNKRYSPFLTIWNHLGKSRTPINYNRGKTRSIRPFNRNFSYAFLLI